MNKYKRPKLISKKYVRRDIVLFIDNLGTAYIMTKGIFNKRIFKTRDPDIFIKDKVFTYGQLHLVKTMGLFKIYI